MKRFMDWLEKGEIIFITTLFFFLVVVVFLQIFTRFVLLKPLMWTEEVARFCFIWLVFMGASVNVRKGAHFAIDLFSHRLTSRAKTYLSFIIFALIGVFAVFLTILGWIFFKVGIDRVSPTIDISMAYIYAAIPLSGLFMLVYTLEFFYREIKRLS